MTDTQDLANLVQDSLYVDPEMELEAQQLANYEDEKRELADLEREVKAQDEYFEEHKEEIEDGLKRCEEQYVLEECSKKGVLIDHFTLDAFRPGRTYQSLNEDGEDDGCSITKCLIYGNELIADPLRVSINQYSGGGMSLCVEFKSRGFDMNIRHHRINSFQEGVDKLNSIVPLIRNLID